MRFGFANTAASPTDFGAGKTSLSSSCTVPSRRSPTCSCAPEEVSEASPQSLSSRQGHSGLGEPDRPHLLRTASRGSHDLARRDGPEGCSDRVVQAPPRYQEGPRRQMLARARGGNAPRHRKPNKRWSRYRRGGGSSSDPDHTRIEKTHREGALPVTPRPVEDKTRRKFPGGKTSEGLLSTGVARRR